MSIFIESLKRLFKANKITNEKLLNMIVAGSITQTDYEYIVQR